MEVEVEPDMIYSGTVNIDRAIWFEDDEFIRIEPGTEMIFGPKGSLNLQGRFEAIGNADNPITLTGSTDTISHTIIQHYNDDNGVFLMEHTNIHNGIMVTSAVENEFKNVHISNDKELVWDDASIRIWLGTFLFEDCSISSNNSGEGLLVHNVEAPVVRNCTFYQVPDAVEYLCSNNGIIANCIFRDMADDAIDNNDCHRTLIENNEFYNVKNRALEIGSDGFGPSTEIMVYNNVFSGCHIGINIKEESTISIDQATFYKTRLNLEILNEAGNETQTELDIKNSVMVGEMAWVKKEDNCSASVQDCLTDKSVETVSGFQLTDITLQDPESENFSITSANFPTGKNAGNMGYQKR